MKPVEQGFKYWWIFKGKSNFCSELVMSDEYTFVKATPEGFYDIVSENDTVEGGIHVVEIAALNYEKEKVKELLNAIKGIQVQTEIFNFAKDEIRVRTANDIAVAVLEKYGSSND